MSLVYSLLFFSSPLFAWGDSLYLDPPRLGSVSMDKDEITWCQCIYTDIVVTLLKEDGQYSIGLRPVPVAERKPIKTFLETASVNVKADSSVDRMTQGYWLSGKLFDASSYNGPWEDIDMMLGRLSPTNYVKVSRSSSGGTEAISGILYISDNSTFRSESGTYQLNTPPLTGNALELITRHAADTTLLETEGVEGIVYLQAGFPLFFYLTDCSQ
ncbi:hypothetical protein GF359_09805 [candidate division WOR-3 bacterium]|uniref:Uncharacterized protein n=1 Tax=candidate division WOR-3 bacterium TaxID=2052148 RepID=A0A9D5KC76_UNCW3|nr:hypothetical protein [candidate division WOR-3 bacterium]MBD3365494.1 hypothetical protein [candidate division WOR-3 bacterium]